MQLVFSFLCIALLTPGHAASAVDGLRAQAAQLAAENRARSAAAAELRRRIALLEAEVAGDPTVDQETAGEHKAEKVTAGEPKAKKTTEGEPKAEKVTSEEPKAEKVTAEEPEAEKVTAGEPAAKKATAEEPAAKKATAGEPKGEETTEKGEEATATAGAAWIQPPLESAAAKREVEDLTESAGGLLSLEDVLARLGFHHYVAGLDEAHCTSVLLAWDAEASRCTFSLLALVAALLALGLLDFAVWWVVCKGKARSVRSLHAQQLAAPPYEALGICACWGMHGRAVLEAFCCPFFMWGETMVRSGSMPWPLVAFVGFIHFVISRIISPLYVVFCLLRCLGRITLRNKLDHRGAGLTVSDCAVVTLCPCCSIAQEAEYLELKANKGQPALQDDQDFQQLLHTNVPKPV